MRAIPLSLPKRYDVHLTRTKTRSEANLREYFIYLMTNRSGTLYVGVTNDLPRRVLEHKQQSTPGFTARYRIDRLVYYETTPDVKAAIAREKQIKSWVRAKKVALIASANPRWEDLSDDWYGETAEPRRS